MRTKRIKRKKIKRYLTILLIALALSIFIYAYKVIEHRCNIRISEIRNDAKNSVKMPIKEVVVKEVVKEEVVKEVIVEKKVEISEREMLARLLYTEARGESIECQKAVVSVVLNRAVNSDIISVIKAPGQFDLGNKLDNIKPLDTQYEVVDYVLENGITIPDDVIYFRSGHFHSFAEDYMQIDSMYFSR